MITKRKAYKTQPTFPLPLNLLEIDDTNPRLNLDFLASKKDTTFQIVNIVVMDCTSCLLKFLLAEILQLFKVLATENTTWYQLKHKLWIVVV